MVTRVHVEGLKELQNALHQLPKKATAKNVMRRVLKKRGEIVASAARSKVPVDKGNLRDSIIVGTKLGRRQRSMHRKADPNDVEVFVGPGQNPSAHLQEFGTSEMAAQPYLRPAWEQTKLAVLSGVRDDLGNEIDKAVARLAKKAAKAKRG